MIILNKFHIRLQIVLLSVFLIETNTYAQDADNGNEYLLPEKTECAIFIQSNDIITKNKFYIRDTGGGEGIFIYDEYFMNLSDSIPSFDRLPFNQEFTDIEWLNGFCFFSSEYSIYICDDAKNTHKILTTNSKIDKIRPVSTGIYFAQDTIISKYYFELNKAESIFRFNERINDFQPIDDIICFAAVGNKLYVINQHGQNIILNDSTNVNALAVHKNGTIFFATNDKVGYIDCNLNNFTITNNGATDLTILEDYLFITLLDNSCVVLSNISNFNSFKN